MQFVNTSTEDLGSVHRKLISGNNVMLAQGESVLFYEGILEMVNGVNSFQRSKESIAANKFWTVTHRVLKHDIGKVKLSLWTFNALVEAGILHHIRQMLRREYSYIDARQSLQNKTIREKYNNRNLGIAITGELNEPLALTWSHVNVFFYCYAIGVILSLLCFALVLLAKGLNCGQMKLPLLSKYFKTKDQLKIFVRHFPLPGVAVRTCRQGGEKGTLRK